MPEKKTALRKRIVPSVPLVLELEDADGSKFIRTFNLTFGMRAIAEMELRTGSSVLKGQIWRNLTANTIAIMLWAAVLEEQPDYDTDDDTGLRVIFSYLDPTNVGPIGDKLWEAFFATLPAKRQAEILAKREEGDAKGGEPADPTKAATEDGLSSGPSLVTTSASASASSAG